MLLAIMVAAVIAAGTAPALADPPPGGPPAAQDIVGLADAATQNLCDQLSLDYDASRPADRVYCWDAVAPPGTAQPGTIVPKKGCKPIPRPVGQTQAIAALMAGGAQADQGV